MSPRSDGQILNETKSQTPHNTSTIEALHVFRRQFAQYLRAGRKDNGAAPPVGRPRSTTYPRPLQGKGAR